MKILGLISHLKHIISIQELNLIPELIPILESILIPFPEQITVLRSIAISEPLPEPTPE